MFFVLKFELILIIGAALDRADLDIVGSSTSHNPASLHGLLRRQLHFTSVTEENFMEGISEFSRLPLVFQLSTNGDTAQ
jgi:hypothetical protein